MLASPFDSSLQYLIKISVSEPMSIALKISDRNKVEKNRRVQTLPRSAFSSRGVLGIPWMARDCSKIIAASAEDFNCSLNHLINISWSASWLSSLKQENYYTIILTWTSFWIRKMLKLLSQKILCHHWVTVWIMGHTVDVKKEEINKKVVNFKITSYHLNFL